MELLLDQTGQNFTILPAHAPFPEELTSLSGRWQFLPRVPKDSDADWMDLEYDAKHWKRLSVPGSWAVMDVPVGCGCYRRSFTLGRGHKGRQVLLRLGAVGGTATVWVNRILIGTVMDTRLNTDLDITSALRSEKNLICIQVNSDNTPLDSGLLGEVSLYTLPHSAITHSDWQVDWDHQTLNLTVHTRSANGFSLRAALMSGNRILSHQDCTVQSDQADVVLSIAGAPRWTSETPRCLRLALILWDGLVTHHTRELVCGLRQVCLEGDSLTVNGVSETLFGTTYYPREPKTGAIAGPEQLQRELRLLREHNFNAIRLTEPGPELLYELCSQLGLYVLDHSESADGSDSALSYQNLAAAHGSWPCVVSWDVPGTREVLPPSYLEIVDSTASIPDKPAILVLSQVPEPELPRILRDIREIPSLWGGFFGIYPEAMGGFSLAQAHALFQPVRFDYRADRLTVENLHRFLSLGQLDCRYTLARDGVPILTRKLALDAHPGGQISTPLDTKYDIYKSGRYHLTAQALFKGTEQVIASAQWEVARIPQVFEDTPGGSLRDGSAGVTMRSSDTAYNISRATGLLCQIQFRDAELLEEPVVPWFTEPSRIHALLSKGNSWKKRFNPKKWPKPAVFEVDQLTRGVFVSFSSSSGLVLNYHLYSDGSLGVDLRLRTGRTVPEKVCVPLSLKDGFTQLRWFGLGPDSPGTLPSCRSYYGWHQVTATTSATLRAPVYEASLTDDTGFGITFGCSDGMGLALVRDGELLKVELSPLTGALEPHSTYTFHFTLRPIE